MKALISCMLEECKRLFAETNDRNNDADRIMKYGHYPRSAVIKLHDAFSEKYWEGVPQLAWLLDASGFTLMNDVMMSPPVEPVSGMYFPVAQFYFAPNVTGDSVQLAGIWGPRYAQGLLLTLDGADEIRIVDRILTWVS